MTDLTKLTTPFGLLDKDTQDALKAWPHGVEVYSEGKAGSGEYAWHTTRYLPASRPALAYRARPAPLVSDYYPWEHIAPEWKWGARDEDGYAYVFLKKPEINGRRWAGVGDHHQVNAFASYRRGTVDWTDSLVERPA